jgi:TolA-binding protein
MRVSEIYVEGNFPLLVVKSKRDFATLYGISAEYWQYFDIDSRPDVLDYLKGNLIDLANHYHALYQQQDTEEEKPGNYAEALRWYKEFLVSFPEDGVSPSINYQLAELLLEHGDFERSAHEYERTAYAYADHEQASAAGYAAIFAHREHLKMVSGAEAPAARLATVDSSLRFAETFPEHEHAPTVLGAASQDLYDMRNFERAVLAGQWLIDTYPQAETTLRRATWMIVAHSSFDLARYRAAEHGYAEVLALTDADDEERQDVVDNLAASIYKQGEQARLQDDFAVAADHFLRIRTAAPTSEIRAVAEYDGAAALIHLEDWLAAADVLEGFQAAYPEHELRPEATRQLAAAYEKAGELSRSAAEYERVAVDATDAEMRREAILVAADLYEQALEADEALRVYRQYIEEFPRPLDTALEIRFKVAGVYDERGDENAYRQQLAAIVAMDGDAGAERTDRSRFLAAQSALVLTRSLYDDFVGLALVQPFEQSLAEKQRRMDAALEAFATLVTYEVGEVTAAATFYMAEIYGHFSDAMLASERPPGLSEAELAEYDLVIEEEAYPFEERAIEMHEENLELMRVGIFNSWIQRSLDQLAVSMPGRYAKHEISSGFVGSIDQYAYRPPIAPIVVPAEGGDAEVSSRDDPDSPSSMEHVGPSRSAAVLPHDNDVGALETLKAPNEIAGLDDAALPL